MTRNKRDFEVGYGKPPKQSRFRKGQSGNPRGRPKGSRNFATDLDHVLSERMTITENGKPRKVSSQHAALLRLRAEALMGNPRALDRLIDLAAERSAAKEAQASERHLSAEEAAILDRFEEDLRRQMQGDGGDDNGGSQDGE